MADFHSVESLDNESFLFKMPLMTGMTMGRKYFIIFRGILSSPTTQLDILNIALSTSASVTNANEK